MFSRFVYLSALISLAAAHGTITAVNGANGVVGAGMGIDPSTPRDGATARPFQQDTSIIRDREIQSGRVGPCGRTNQKGALDMAAEMEGKFRFNSASSSGLPSATASGEIQMTLHQINQDGAGPYTCDISADGGNTFQAAKVNKNVPGAFLGLSTATAEDFPLNVQMPAGMQCAGGPNGDACVVRCRNATPAGPFGSCAVVTNAQSAGNNTAAGTGKKAAAAAAPATGAGAGAGAGTQTGAQQGGGFAGGLKKLFGGRRSLLNRLDSELFEKRALAGPDDFAADDEEAAKLEEELIADLYKRSATPAEKKRVVRSRVVGSLSGYWI